MEIREYKRNLVLANKELDFEQLLKKKRKQIIYTDNYDSLRECIKDGYEPGKLGKDYIIYEGMKCLKKS